MAVTGYPATGITVTFSTLTGCLLDVKSSGEKADVVDITHQTSTSSWREFKAGLLDGGEWTMTFLHDPDAVVPAVGTSGALVINWPSGTTNKERVATALLTGRGTSASLGDKMTLDLTFKVSGIVDHDYT